MKQETYNTKCICGEEITSTQKQIVCPKCKRLLDFSRWGTDAEKSSDK